MSVPSLSLSLSLAIQNAALISWSWEDSLCLKVSLRCWPGSLREKTPFFFKKITKAWKNNGGRSSLIEPCQYLSALSFLSLFQPSLVYMPKQACQKVCASVFFTLCSENIINKNAQEFSGSELAYVTQLSLLVFSDLLSPNFYFLSSFRCFRTVVWAM